MMAFWGVFGVLACCLAVCDARDVVSLAMGWWVLLCMRCGYGSVRFEDWLLVAAILVFDILMYK